MRKLTKLEFIAALPKTKNYFNWKIDIFGKIRAKRKFVSRNDNRESYCPLTAIEYVVTKNKVLEMDASDVESVSDRIKDYVISAADSTLEELSEGSYRTDREYRKLILNALNLKEIN